MTIDMTEFFKITANALSLLVATVFVFWITLGHA